MIKENSKHILNASATLLGFCLVVLTTLKISNFNSQTLIDEFTGVACIFLAASSLLSFLSIRAKDEKINIRYENTAEIIFISALLFVFAICVMVAFSVIL